MNPQAAPQSMPSAAAAEPARALSSEPIDEGPCGPSERRWRISAVVVAMLVLAALTIFSLGDVDLALATWCRDPHGSGAVWPYESAEPWLSIYHVGIWPGIAVVVLGAAFALGGLWRPFYQRWWRSGLAGVLILALGPGLIVNTVLKDNWGRPRPRDTLDLGPPRELARSGPFQRPWVLSEAKGRSFPSGHAAPGFLLCAGFLVLRRRRIAIAFLVAGFGLGGALGIARMMQGGHYLSDVVWSALIVGVVTLVVTALLARRVPS